MKIVCDDKIPFLKGVLEEFAHVVYLSGAKTDAAAVKDASALITRTRTKCNAEILAGSQVEFIASATIGFDHIDTEYCAANGIEWTNAAGCNSASVAQYICSCLLNLAERHSLTLKNMTLGVVGVGNVGSKVAHVGRSLGMNVLLNDPPRAEKEGNDGFCELTEIIEKSDFITLHVPLEKSGSHPTFHLADASFIAGMKSDSFLINSSRGAVCDNQALKAALKSRAIAGAVLDVWENEPNIDCELLGLLDFATPHIAGYSTDGKANGTAMSVQALARHFSLPLTNWRPSSVPEPEQTKLKISAAGIQRELLDAVNFSYNINTDSDTLKKSPAALEEQRGNYPLRREFVVFTIENASAEAAAILNALGFSAV